MPSQAARNREKTSAALKTTTLQKYGQTRVQFGSKPAATSQAYAKAQAQKQPDRRDRRNRITVRKGDTLNTLAGQYGVAPEDIVNANNGVITYRPGIKITIPGNRLTTPDETRYTQQLTGTMAKSGANTLTKDVNAAITNPNNQRLYGYENELIYQRQLVKTESNIRLYNQFPDYMTDRTMTSLGLAAADMQDLGYIRDGNYWVATDAVGGLPEAPAAGGAGGGTSGYRKSYRRYGGGGGGGGGGGRSGTKAQPMQHVNIETGTPANSLTGRAFSPDILGLIHWRL